MTRRLRRLAEFELELRILDDAFIRPPREAQRNWLLNRTLGEAAEELRHLDRAAARFVAGRDRAGPGDRQQGELDDDDIMEDWQIPVMRAMADIVTRMHGDVLEVGFGRGISATFIQDAGVRSHTIVECNDSVVERFRRWRTSYAANDIRLIHGLWQDTTDRLESYDGIFFHTYPLDDDEYAENVVRSVTFAANFFPTAAAHLRPGGVFTYLTNEADSLSRAHQRLLLRHFDRFTLGVIEPLDVPADSRDDLWADSMVLVEAIR